MLQEDSRVANEEQKGLVEERLEQKSEPETVFQARG